MSSSSVRYNPLYLFLAGLELTRSRTAPDFHLWSLSKEDHIATLKFNVTSRKSGESPVLSDLYPVEQAAKAVLEKAKVRKDSV